MHPALVEINNFEFCSRYGAHKPYRYFLSPFVIGMESADML